MYQKYIAFFDEYVTGDKQYKDIAEKPVISIETNDLRDIIKTAYMSGVENSNNSNTVEHIEAINQILQMIENLL